MQNFTKPYNPELQTTKGTDNIAKTKIDLTAVPNLTAEAKKGFIESRMNKDNFWNFMFAVGSWSCAMTGNLIVALLIMPILVKLFNNTKFIDSKFFNSENKELYIPKQLPNGFFIIIVIAAGTIFLAKYDNLPNIISLGVFTFWVFCIPVLFFIFKNCPISILFNYQLYKQTLHTSKSFSYKQRSSSSYEHSKSSINQTSTSWIIDPTRYNQPGNIYYHRHHNRH